MSEPFDIVVVGAGDVGSAIARELSRYELRVALVDRGDVCAVSQIAVLEALGRRLQLGGGVLRGGDRANENSALQVEQAAPIAGPVVVALVGEGVVSGEVCVERAELGPKLRNRLGRGLSAGRAAAALPPSRQPSGALSKPEPFASLYSEPGASQSLRRLRFASKCEASVEPCAGPDPMSAR